MLSNEVKSQMFVLLIYGLRMGREQPIRSAFLENARRLDKAMHQKTAGQSKYAKSDVVDFDDCEMLIWTNFLNGLRISTYGIDGTGQEELDTLRNIVGRLCGTPADWDGVIDRFGRHVDWDGLKEDVYAIACEAQVIARALEENND